MSPADKIRESTNKILIDNSVKAGSLVLDNIISDMVMEDGDTMDSLDWMNIVLGLESEFSIEISEEDQFSLYGGSLSKLYDYIILKY